MNVVLDVESFLQPGGICEKTIEDLFESEIFFLGRESIHVTFFVKFMADDASCIALQKLLYELSVLYLDSYRKNVSSTAGDIENRMKSGKVMVIKFENDRNDARESNRRKFVSLSVVRILFEEPQNEEVNRSTFEQSDLLFCYLEDLLYKNFWKWLHHISSTTERSIPMIIRLQCFTKFMI